MKKETLYIDVEDDITSVIEKIADIKEKIVAIVPPKRSGVLSSVVNLKLVNKSAHDAGKRVVLITTDKTMISLAGGVGMYVAPNLQSAPAIPAVSAPPEDMPSEIISEGATETPVGGKVASRVAPATEKTDDEPKTEPADDAKPAKDPSKKKMKIPDFGLFKKRLLLIILGVILLIAGWIWAFYIAPSAHITLEGQTNRIPTDVNFTVDTSFSEANFDKKELPATSKELKKDQSESFTPSGEENLGDKASGTVKIVNCNTTDTLAGTVRTVKAGTTVSKAGRNFITQSDVKVQPSNFIGNSCQKNKPSSPVNVTASEGGDDYNLAASENGVYDYAISGHSSMSGQGSTMSGGTDDIVKVVSKADVEKAKEAALTQLREGAEENVKSQFPDDVFVLSPSFSETITEATSSVPVGERADTASVKVAITFFALGVNKDTMTEFLKSRQKSTLETNQAIFNTGLDTAKINKLKSPSSSRQKFNLKTDAFAGPDVNLDELRKALAGKAFGESKRALESLPGVTKAEIDLSPFWVFSMPKRTSTIVIDIKVN